MHKNATSKHDHLNDLLWQITRLQCFVRDVLFLFLFYHVKVVTYFATDLVYDFLTQVEPNSYNVMKDELAHKCKIKY